MTRQGQTRAGRRRAADGLWAAARDRSGATAIELAIVLPVLLALVFATLDYGRLRWWDSTLRYAVQEGARCATIGTAPGYCCADASSYACGGGNTPSDYAASKAVGLGLTAANFALTSPACGQQMKATNVTFTFIVTSVPGLDLTGGKGASWALAPQACYP
jgi:Flp pilus assembly protein TadG